MRESIGHKIRSPLLTNSWLPSVSSFLQGTSCAELIQLETFRAAGAEGRDSCDRAGCASLVSVMIEVVNDDAQLEKIFMLESKNPIPE